MLSIVVFLQKNSKKGKGDKATTAIKALDKIVDFSGKWKGIALTPMGEIEQVFNFTIEGTTLTGTIETPRGTQDLSNGQVAGNTFSFEVSFGQFTMVQNGEVVAENKIVLRNDRGEMTLDKME